MKHSLCTNADMMHKLFSIEKQKIFYLLIATILVKLVLLKPFYQSAFFHFFIIIALEIKSRIHVAPFECILEVD
jgi:hypothetical protein